MSPVNPRPYFSGSTPVWILLPLFVLFSHSLRSDDSIVLGGSLLIAVIAISLLGFYRIKKSDLMRQRAFELGNLQFGLMQLLWIIMALPHNGSPYLIVFIPALVILLSSPLYRSGRFYIFSGMVSLAIYLIADSVIGSTVQDSCSLDNTLHAVGCSLSEMYAKPVLAAVVLLTLLSAGENFFRFLFLSSVFFGGYYFTDADRSIRLTAFLAPFVFYPGNPIRPPMRWMMWSLILLSPFPMIIKFAPDVQYDYSLPEYFSIFIITGFFALEFLMSMSDFIFSLSYGKDKKVSRNI